MSVPKPAFAKVAAVDEVARGGERRRRDAGAQQIGGGSLGRPGSKPVGERAIVSVQNPVRLDGFSEPEPDFALLKPRPDFYQDAPAGPADVLLLIEVADTSLNYDRVVKRALYARHAIPEFWIVDLTSGEVEVCREPKADGYATVERIGRDGALEPQLLPGIRIQASTLFR